MLLSMSGENAQTWFVDPEKRVVSTAFDDRETHASRRLNAALVLALAPNAESVLDVGCGGGEMLSDIRALGPTLRLVGIDPVPEAVAAARQRHSGDDRATFLVGSAEALPGLPSIPDLAVSHLNLGLWTDPMKGLTAILHALAPGGTFVVIDVAAAQTPSQREAFLGLACSDDERTYLEAQLEAAFTPTQLEQLLREAGVRAGRRCTIHAGRGGLAGHPYGTPEALALFDVPAVQQALSQLSGSGAAADTIFTAVVRVV